MKLGVVQLIDSLNIGGAEKVAVVLANRLPKEGYRSHLVTTRLGGALHDTIDSHVHYHHLHKKRVLDIQAILGLRRYIKTHEIDIIHAHSSSLFTAVLVKFLSPKVRIVWHDHWGARTRLNTLQKCSFKMASLFVKHIIVVSEALLDWNRSNLYCSRVTLVRNGSELTVQQGVTELRGTPGKRVALVAGLKKAKDHITALKAFRKVIRKEPDASLHIVGKDLGDNYAKKVFQYIAKHKMDAYVFYYGECNDIGHILSQVQIGMLSSETEGLPLALVEYGLAKKAIVTTDVGNCLDVVGDSTFVVPPKKPTELAEAILALLKDEALLERESHRVHLRIQEVFGLENFVKKIQLIYKETL